MSDLSRLLESSDDEAALSLLRSAHEEPPEGSMGRVAAALGIGVGGALVSSASATALLASKAHAASLASASVVTEAAVAPTPWLASVIVKPLAIGLLGGLAAVGGVSYVSSSAPRPAEPRTLLATAPRAATAKVAPRVPPPALPAVPAELNETPAPKSEPHRAVAPALLAANPQRNNALTPKHEAQPAPATASFAPSPPALEAPSVEVRPPAPQRDEALARELAILGRARSQLVAGDAAGALRSLDEYSAERRSGALEPEATTLRIQALERAGARAAAARLAQSFLKAHPERSHDPSLRSIAAEAP